MRASGFATEVTLTDAATVVLFANLTPQEIETTARGEAFVLGSPATLFATIRPRTAKGTAERPRSTGARPARAATVGRPTERGAFQTLFRQKVGQTRTCATRAATAATAATALLPKSSRNGKHLFYFYPFYGVGGVRFFK